MIILLYIAFPFLYQAIKKHPKIMFAGLLLYFIVITNCYPFAGMEENDVLVRIFDFSMGIYRYLYLKNIHPWQAVIAMAVWGIGIAARLPIPTMYLIEAQGISLYLLFFSGITVGKVQL